MKPRHRGSLGTTLVGPIAMGLVLGITQPSAGQAASRPFEDLGRYLEPGDPIFVVGRESGGTRGTLERLSPTSLVVRADGLEREIASSEVGWIEEGGEGPGYDPLWNGILESARASARIRHTAQVSALDSQAGSCRITRITMGARQAW